MDDTVRQTGVDHCMDVVMAKVHERKLLPAVLIAVDEASGEVCVLPCGPTTRDVIATLIRGVAEGMQNAVVEDVK